MAQTQAQSAASTKYLTASGMLVLTAGFQNPGANAVSNAPLPEQSEPTTELQQITNILADNDTPSVSPVEPNYMQPRFSQLKNQVQRLIKADAQPAPQLSATRLENHRRDLHRRSNEVESHLLGVQHLLSIQSYGTSFADRLLEQDVTYQTKLQQIRTIETDIHIAIKQADAIKLEQLQKHLNRTDWELRQLAQNQLRQYVVQAQITSTSGLWQEPMYRESLRWLMEHTHDRHLLRARQQILARTTVAVAPD